MEALRAGCCAFLGRAAAEAVVVAALGAHAGLRPAHVTWAKKKVAKWGWKATQKQFTQKNAGMWTFTENAG